MEVSGQLYVAAALTSSRKVFVTHWTGGCSSRRATLDGVVKEVARGPPV